uniref:centromere protein O-like isoform X2 n=1 Tax=Myxine glutinosa TaxID=7769 RepID=UPI0035901A1C
MELARRQIDQDTLTQLDAFEARAELLTECQDESRSTSESMDRARREIKNLQAKRDELRRRLHNQPEHSLNELLNFPSNESRDLPRERRCAFLSAKIMQLQSQLQIYNLAGISMHFNNGKRELQVWLNTAIAGKYHESYTVELSDPLGDSMTLCRQSLPPVMPVEDLSCQFLPRDPSSFIWALSEHLNSFVMRREMVQRTENEFENMLLRGIVFNAMYTLIEFSFRFPTKDKDVSMEIRLEFPDLQTQPCKVEVSVKGGRDGDYNREVKKVQQSLLSKPLPEALRHLCLA